jgi:phage terminase Nu1 subunit (DNA packaging protein)
MREHPLSKLLLVGTTWRNIGWKFTMGPQPRSSPSDLVSGLALARWLGVTDKTVRELAKAGIAVRGGRGLYKLEESVRRYCEHVRRTASQRGGEASLAKMRDERIRIAKGQADALALKNAAARGEMLYAAAVEAEWSGVLRNVRAGMLAVPSRAGARLPTRRRTTSPKLTPRCVPC